MEKTKMEHAHEQEQEGGIGGVLGCCEKVMQFGEFCTTIICARAEHYIHVYIFKYVCNNIHIHISVFIYNQGKELLVI